MNDLDHLLRNLPHSLARELEPRSDLLKLQGLIPVRTETQRYYPLIPRRQPGEQSVQRGEQFDAS
jgi:hypothetical protein